MRGPPRRRRACSPDWLPLMELPPELLIHCLSFSTDAAIAACLRVLCRAFSSAVSVIIKERLEDLSQPVNRTAHLLNASLKLRPRSLFRQLVPAAVLHLSRESTSAV